MEELDPVFNRVAAYFGLLSEPMRLKIMHAICLEERSVSEIVAATGATQTSVSRHLNRMHAAAAVSRRREGNQVYYKVADANLVELCRNVCVRIAAEIDEQQPMRKDLLQLIPKRPRAAARNSRRTARHG
jgi:DNA-binding transcriptional ArsR family regulator